MTGEIQRSYFWVMLLGLGSLSCSDPPDNKKITGYIEAEYVYVSAPTSGQVVSVHTKEGDLVYPGDVLFQLESDRQQAAVQEAIERLKEAEAFTRDKQKGSRAEEITAIRFQLVENEAALRLAETERARWHALMRQGYASKSREDLANTEYDVAKARVEVTKANILVARLAAREDALKVAEAGRNAAEAALAQTKWALDQTTIVAPVGGRVEEIFQYVGEMVQTGTPLLALLPKSAMKVRFFIPQAKLPQIRLGARVQVIADGLPAPTDAHISYIAVSAEFTPPVIYSVVSREKLVFLVEAILASDHQLMAGLPVEVFLP